MHNLSLLDSNNRIRYTCQYLDTENVMATTNTAVRSYSNKDYRYVNHCTVVITQNNKQVDTHSVLELHNYYM